MKPLEARRREPRQERRTTIERSVLLKAELSNSPGKPPFHARFHGGWRTGVAWGALAGLLVLLINVFFLIWIRSSFTVQDDGTVTVFEGSCQRKKELSAWSHMVINICSTLLLSASNNAMQCLVAPTRADIDRAHKQNIWLDIGIQTLRNLRYINGTRRVLWTILGLSSIPLHLLYNSVITTSSSVNDYMMVLATEDFLSGAPIDQSYKWSQIYTADIASLENSDYGIIMGPEIDYDEIWNLQYNYGDLTVLNNSDCAKAYNSDLVSSLRNVLLISNTSGVGSILNIFTHATQASPVMPWFCGNELTTNTSCSLKNVTDQSWPMQYSSCLQGTVYVQESGVAPLLNQNNETVVTVHYPNDKIQSQGDKPATYNITYPTNCSLQDALWVNDNSSSGSYGYSYPILDNTLSIAHVQYCLAQKVEERCRVSFNSLVLLIVILCNILKTASLIALLLLPHFTPIVCIGDAISSFLDDPDPCTLEHVYAPVSWNLQPRSWLDAKWLLRRKHWFTGASPTQWALGYVALGGLWAGCLIIIFLTSNGSGSAPNLSTMWISGFGSVHASSATSVSPSFMGNVLVANSPQLLASAAYLLYNQLITSMVLTSECNDFAIHRKALRVSKPAGRQRSTYYLQLPYRYAFPLMVTSCLLHWLISQSFFFVNLLIFGINGERRPSRDILACGWSPIAIVFTLIVSGMMLIGIFILGSRRYSLEMQIMRSNSLKISAACHPPNSVKGAALQPVEYGVVDLDGEPGRWRACFTSSRDVAPLSTKVPKRDKG